MRTQFAIAALVCALAIGQAFAQAPATQSDIVVNGRQPSLAPPGDERLARWDRHICPGVVGLQTQYAQAVADRIAAHAIEVGLDIGEPGCRPDILVMFTRDGDALARDLVDHHQDTLGFSSGDTQSALQAFATASRPVRWWQATQTVAADGQILSRPGALSQFAGDMRDGAQQVTRSTGASRLRSSSREDLSRVVIVVDLTKTAPATLDALAEYISMVALARIDPNADTARHSSILNLFSGAGARPATLTDWDAAYLRGLYSIDVNARTANSQEGEIARRMGN